MFSLNLCSWHIIGILLGSIKGLSFYHILLKQNNYFCNNMALVPNQLTTY